MICVGDTCSWQCKCFGSLSLNPFTWHSQKYLKMRLMMCSVLLSGMYLIDGIWREKYFSWSPSATCPHSASWEDAGLALVLSLIQAALKGIRVFPQRDVFAANSETISIIKVKTRLSAMVDYLLPVEKCHEWEGTRPETEFQGCI